MTTTTYADSSSAASSFARFAQAPLLTREDESELARLYRDHHDPAVARRLVESHLRLVVKIARQCCSRPSLLPDLIQEGCLGLMRAIEKYDPDRGVRLSSYGAWWIRAYIYQFIMANARIMKVATTFAQRTLFFHLHQECQRLERDGKEADSKDIAEHLGIPEKVVTEMRTRLGGREVPFETTVAVDSGPSQQRVDGISAPGRPDDMVEEHQLRSAVRKKLAEVAPTLDAREWAIIEERLLAERPITLRSLGARFGVSRERTRQIEERLKKRLQPLFVDLYGQSPDAGAAAPALVA